MLIKEWKRSSMTKEEAQLLLKQLNKGKTVSLPSNVSFDVVDIIWGDDEVSDTVVQVKVRDNRTYNIPYEWLTVDSVNTIIDNYKWFMTDLCDFKLTLVQKEGGFEQKANIVAVLGDFSDMGPVSLADFDSTPLEMITYNVNDIYYDVRREGYTLLVAPTGGGKTYNAIRNIPMLSSHFDEILYLNYELSKNDIVNRAKQMNVDLSKVKAWDNTNISALLKYAEGKSIAFIVDNIDNLVGLTADTYMAQVRFIQDLDRFLKNTNNHALILTQFVKDSSIELFDKNGSFSTQINQNIVSGAKQISNNARSGIFAAYNPHPEINQYVSTWIKRGEGKSDTDRMREFAKGM